jgi:hypothetical protein
MLIENRKMKLPPGPAKQPAEKAPHSHQETSKNSGSKRNAC